MKYITKIAAASSLLLAMSCSNKYRVWQGTQKEEKIFNLPYGPHERNILDVYIPDGVTEEAPICIIVHGGAWKFGKKEHLKHLQKHLHSQGIITGSMNYRLVKSGGPVTYKEQLADIDAAVKKILATLAPLHPEKRTVTLLGESAGGHLALLYGYQHPQIIDRVISMSGPADFISPQYRHSKYYERSHRTFEDVVGKKYADTASWKSFEEASPIYQKEFLPTLIFQGNRDFLVDEKQGLALDSVLTAHQVKHELVYMDKTGHVARFNPKKRDTIVYPHIVDFVKKKL